MAHFKKKDLFCLCCLLLLSSKIAAVCYLLDGKI